MPTCTLANREKYFSDLLLPQLVKTFVGFTQENLRSILGNNAINNLIVRSDVYLLNTDLVAFNLAPSETKPAIASIQAHINTHPFRDVPPYAYLHIDAFNLNEHGRERGVCLHWENVEEVDDLALEQIQVLALGGESFYKKGATLTHSHRKKKPELGKEGFGEQENMHEIKIVPGKKENTFKAVNQFDELYEMIEVTLINGVYEVKACADGTVFNSPFSLAIPQHIKIDQGSYPELLSTIKTLS